MSNTRIRDRIFAGFGAVLFLVTASAFTISVVWDGLHKKSTSDTTAATTQSSTSQTKLTGTKLTNFAPLDKIDTLQTTDTKVGDGVEVKAGQTVTVDYTGAVAATGTVFESSLDSGQTATFGLDQVIKGWTEGIPGMKVGGTRRLLIPAAMAYGENPPAGSTIPANADLVFDVTLKAVK